MSGTAAVTAIVLAGGRSSRFGSPKLDVEIDGATLLDRAIDGVAAVAGEIIVAGPLVPSLGSRITPRLRIIADEQPFSGPLVALAGVLRETTTELAIVVGGDMPWLVPAVLGLMLGRLRSDTDIDAVVLETAASNSPLHQVLPLGLRVGPARIAAGAAMAAGDRAMVRLIDRLRIAKIPDLDWSILDPTGQSVLDIDLPADLERVRPQGIF